MNDSEKQLINEFFSCAVRLYDAGIVRSDKILGDLGEWFCVQRYGLVLASSGRNVGFDGCIGEKRVQVKVHNSKKGTNVFAGNPDKYDELFVLLGPRSRLRIDDTELSFLVYRFSSDEVKASMKSASGYYCAKATIQNRTYESIAL